MVSGREVERRRLADAPDLDCVLLGHAVWRFLARRVGDRVEQRLPAAFDLGELFLQRLELLFDAFELGQLLWRRLALHLPLGAQLFDSRLHATDGAIGVEKLVEQLGRSFAGERGPKAVGVVAGGTQVDHARESRYPSRTCATPSSSTEGHTRSAAALTRSCAFATATP